MKYGEFAWNSNEFQHRMRVRREVCAIDSRPVSAQFFFSEENIAPDGRQGRG
jgi:hypothetical protein